MRNVVIHSPGGYDKLRIEEHPAPRLKPGHVRVRVAASGVNFADCVVRMGLYESARVYVGWPITPGFEIAGTVTEVAGDVQDPALAVGAEVVGVTRFGGYAAEVVLPTHHVWPRPAALSLEEAAAFPTTHLTAWYALCELTRPRPGSTVLVHSAAGGVGTALCAIAKHLGCRVIGAVGSSRKVETARAYGADVVIDTSRQDLWAAAERAAPGGYDIILDANGVATLRQSYRHLAPGGKLVVYGFHTMFSRGRGRPKLTKLVWDFLRTPRFSPLDMTNKNRAVLAFNLSYMFDKSALLTQAMDELFGWLASGVLPSPKVQSFPVERVADAHRALESGSTAGKLVLTWDSAA